MKDEDLLIWDSKRMIGNVHRRFKQLERKGWDWSSFYNGWLEGRFSMLTELLSVQRADSCAHLVWTGCSEGSGEYSCKLGCKTSAEKCEANIEKCEGHMRNTVM